MFLSKDIFLRKDILTQKKKNKSNQYFPQWDITYAILAVLKTNEKIVGPLTCQELTYFIYNKYKVNQDILNLEKNVYKKLRQLIRMDLVQILPQDLVTTNNNARAKYYYIITPQGEELLTFINPINSQLFPNYYRIPYNLKKAHCDINFILGRTKKKISKQKIKEICSTKKIGNFYFVFKYEPLQKMQKLFVKFPLVAYEEVLNVLLEGENKINKTFEYKIMNIFNSKNTIEYFVFLDKFCNL